MNPTIFTVASYNICHGVHAAFDWDRLTAAIRTLNADLVGIQEVDMHTRRSGGCDSITALVAASGLPHALFVPTMDYDGGQYGTAILSRYPIEETVTFPLPTAGLEPRVFGAVRVSLPDGTPLWFANTHLSYKSAAVRGEQLATIERRMRADVPPALPVIITGDFNTEEPLVPVVGDRYAAVNENRRYVTFRTLPIAIDNIIYPPAHLTPLDSGMIESDASDHNLLWCRFSY